MFATFWVGERLDVWEVRERLQQDQRGGKERRVLSLYELERRLELCKGSMGINASTRVRNNDDSKQ